jgi:hypothetical protein
MSDTLAATTTIIGLAINAAGLVFVATQVVLARRQLQDNIDLSAKEALRVKRQATVDFYMTTMQKVSEWRSILPGDWDRSGIDAYLSSAYGRDGRAKIEILASYLQYFEALAVAVRFDIHDLSVLDLIAGSRIMNICENYRSFFVNRRKEVGVELALSAWESDRI